MVKAVDPVVFDSALRSVLEEHDENLLKNWDPPVTPYTYLITKIILPEVAKRLRLICHPYEYYTLDCVFLAEYDTESFGPESGYPTAFSVIIEHENIAERSREEMSKLLLFNSPLKVLITYAKEPHIEQHLARYQRMIERSGNADLACSRQRILVLFGCIANGRPSWKSFTYGPTGFAELVPNGA